MLNIMRKRDGYYDTVYYKNNKLFFIRRHGFVLTFSEGKLDSGAIGKAKTKSASLRMAKRFIDLSR